MDLAELMKKADQMTVNQDSDLKSLEIVNSDKNDQIRSLDVVYSMIEPTDKQKTDEKETKISDAKKQELKEEAEAKAKELLEQFDGLKKLGLTVELLGTWFWISGETKKYKEAIKAIEIPDYKKGFTSSKNMWYFSPIGYRKRTHRQWTKEEIDEKFNPIEL